MTERAFSLEVERFLHGELSPAEVAKLRERLGAEELARLEREHAAQVTSLLASHPGPDFVREVRARAARERAPTRVWRLPQAVFAAAVMAALGLVCLRAVDSPPHPSAFQEPTSERLKGLAPRLMVFRRHPAAVEELSPGARVRPHDQLQLAYAAAGIRYGAIVSIDGAGTVTLHSPENEHAPAALEPSGRRFLESAYELDEAPRFERFVLVTSSQPVDLQVVLQAARALARQGTNVEQRPLSLPPAYQQTSFLVSKELP